eukprot:TRINITY_DN57479_c0_g1_i1.p1 TRINITY_DN57479_c0_g1~~TRINITY_DN57479_c0_g1_i1.p1  ORF type:complete len:293 (+),score=92.19 TRINITY_DN57479_c0_g1_i1:79-879(+)
MPPAAPPATQAPAVQSGPCDRNWARTLQVAGCIGNVLVGVLCVLDIIGLAGFNLPELFLDIFLVALASAALFAELGMSMGYCLLKWVFFLTTYAGRALFYIFMASVFIDTDDVLNIMLAVFLLVVGAVGLAVSLLRSDLPVYGDADIQRREEARMKEFAPPPKNPLKSSTRRPSQQPLGHQGHHEMQPAAPMDAPQFGQFGQEPNPFAQPSPARDSGDRLYPQGSTPGQSHIDPVRSPPAGGPAGGAAGDELERQYEQMIKGGGSV